MCDILMLAPQNGLIQATSILITGNCILLNVPLEMFSRRDLQNLRAQLAIYDI